MAFETMAVLVALGLLAAVLAGVEPRRRVERPPTPDDGPLGLGAGRTARCPVCAQTTLELVGVRVRGDHDLPRVRCGFCRSSYTVRGTLASIPDQRRVR